MTALALPQRRDLPVYGAMLALGIVLDLLCRFFPADLPFWMPWEFSWPEYLACVLTLFWFWRGLSMLPAGQRPAKWRRALFVAGIASFWIVLQTHIDYYAQHMFFVHRWAHFVLHHAGAFAIAFGMGGQAVFAGMPQPLQTWVRSPAVQRPLAVLQHPVVAPVLFVGLLYFWLIPSIHTVVMLNRPLYEVMNWSMALNGVMFWSLILDARARPPARLSFLMRLLLIIVIELPQMVLGAILSLTERDLYPVYDICGRVLEMTALNDVHYGGLIIWLPGTLTSFAAFITVLVTMRLSEEAAERGAP